MTQPNGTTVLMLAAGVGSPALDRRMRSKPPVCGRPTEAVVLADAGAVRDRCGDINAFNADGNTALIGALGRGERVP